MELKTDPNEKIFYKTLENSRKDIETAAVELENLEGAKVKVQVQQQELSNEMKVMEERLASLQKRRNRIPIEQIKIREGLLKRLNLEEADLPFAAELMKVKEDEKDWETQIEQVLRPLSLSLLIPEKHYEFIIKSISKTKLNGKVFFRKVSDFAMKSEGKVSKNSLIQKIEIRKNHQYSEWLENVLKQEFNVECSSGYGSFEKSGQEVNKYSLIKNHQQHERDDTPTGMRHILGWDNRETILEVQKEMKDLHGEIMQLQRSLDDFQRQQKAIIQRRDNLNKLITYEQFSEIDWKSFVKNSKSLELEKEKLMSSSNQLQELENQLREISSQIRDAENARDRLVEQKGTLQNRLDNYSQQLEEAEEILKSISTKKNAEAEAKIYQKIDVESLVVSTIQRVENKVLKEAQLELSSHQREAAKIERRLSLAMQKFINPSVEVLEKYPNWTADTIDLQPDIRYLSEFELIYNKIRQEDLPKFQKRFKDWLNERLIFDIANFKTSLENKEAIIEESIEQINSSLLDIDFSTKPLTYIQLDVHKTRDNAVRDFKEMLKDAMPDPAKLIQGEEKALEESFKKIQKIIEELSNNENWRRKVTDVRNWLEFAAIERYRTDKSERQYYQDSQSLSGGEKAKLAYTILASAIAYQFGIRNRNNERKSFRFAVVDEAFSKVDPENSIYAMELFKQLNLQLMVVTPLDKINLAEPYIHAVHYVQNKNKKNSEVFDMPMEVYQAKKKEFTNL